MTFGSGARENVKNENDLLLWYRFPRISDAILRVQRGNVWDERGGRGPVGGGRCQAGHRHGEASGGGRRHRPPGPYPEIGVQLQ